MAHELYLMEDGTYSMCRAADTEKSWHGLENVVPVDAPYDVWLQKSGMAFNIKSATVEYNGKKAHPDGFPTRRSYMGKRVLYRDDNCSPLSIVSDDYSIVQPRQVLDFFTELCQRYNLKMDTAGVIRGGVKFWAMARTGNQTDVGLRDIIKQYVVLASSADASMATTAKHTIKRIVCSNTFHANVGNFEPAIKVSHSTQFNAEAVKIDLGLMDREFDSIGELVKEMHNEKITDPDARRWFAELLSGKVKMDTDEVNAYATTARLFQTVFDSYKNGRGAENTIWGLFNGVTYTIDHVRGRTVDSQLDSALFGSGAQVKGKAWRKAVLLLGQI